MLRKILLLLLLAGFSFITAKAASISASFSVSPATTLCQDSTFTFTNTSTHVGSGTVTYKWYFGDTKTSTSTSPTHTYATSGTFTVKLVAYTSDAGDDSVTTKVTVNVKPVSKFKLIAGNTYCQNYELSFINQSTIASGSISKYYWDFGNGKTTTVKEPAAVYPDTGKFVLMLVTTSDKGCTDTFRQNIYVNPRPKISYKRIERCEDSLSYVDASASNSTSLVTNYRWIFDDSSSDVSGSSQSSITHAFKYPGRHIIQLIVTGKYGCGDTSLIPVNVFETPKSSITWMNTCVDSVFKFFDKTSIRYGRLNYWKWDFGDGTVASYTERKDTLQHIYNNAGTYKVSLKLQSEQGCTSTDTFIVNVRYLPATKFAAKQTCQDTAMQFIDMSSVTDGTVKQWLWDFADTASGTANSSTSQNPTHFYQFPGTYNVKLITWSNYGCKDSFSRDVVVYPKPQADFGFGNNCQDSLIRFTDASAVTNSTIVKWRWDFGDTTAVDTAQNPIHAYKNPGTFNVRLVVWSKVGCNDTLVKKITVFPLPKPDFTYSGSCSRDTLVLEDKSTIPNGTIFSRSWNFDDGYTANGATVKHSFSLPGKYNVRMTVLSDLGCPISITKQIVIMPRPRASFDYASACIGTSTTFSDKSSVDTPNTINGWLWSFGDGSPSKTGQIVTHNYTSAGTFIVRLVVFTAKGCTDTVRQSVSITPTPIASFKAGDNCLDSAIQFTDASSVSSGSIVDWQWDFGDSTPIATSTRTPIHKYDSAGTFTVKLIVVTDNGCRDSTTRSITIHPQPETEFTFTTNCADSVVVFTDSTKIVSGSVTNWFWDFGDGGTSTDQSPQYKYFKGGTYTVTLTAISDKSCQSRKIQQVIVLPLPVVGFQAQPACPFSITRFFDETQSADPIVGRLWRFGDGDTTTDEYASHIYKDSGTYNVTLVVKTSKGCVDSLVKTIHINPLPVVKFSWTGHCVGEKISFTDSSYVVNGRITGWNWQYGDGGTESTTSPFASHTYADTGTYDVVVTVTGNNTCSTSDTMKLHIYPLPVVSFTSDTACFESVTHLRSTATITEGTIDAYLWTFEDGSTEEGADIYHVLPKSGNNIVKLTLVSDQGCTQTGTQQIYVNPKPTAAFNATPNPASILNPLVQFTDKSKNAVNWQWKFGDGFTSTETSPSHLYQDTGAYDAVQIVTNSIGCSDTIRHVVIVHQDYILNIPNIFTPNEDNFNTTWKPIGSGIHDYTLKVYDRWGQLVFETTDFDESWNGKYENKGQLVPDGVYKYLITLTDYSQQSIKKIVGTVTVLK